MDTSIEIQWIGHRKDGSKRGAIYGWFIEKGKPAVPLTPWECRSGPEAKAYVFRGRIGKKMHIEEKELTDAFMSELSSLKKNYKTVEIEKVINNWGSVFNEELSMFVMLLKLKA